MKAVQNCQILRTIPLLVAVCLIGVPAQAKYGGGTGEPNDPFVIYTAEQMNAIGADPSDWSRHFKLMAEINLGIYTGTDFNIIGTSTKPFTGVFDGNGHTVSNFTWNSVNGSYLYVGLFAYVADPNAEIKNLGLIDPNIDAGTVDRVGSSLVGYLADGILTNCYVKGGSVSGNSYVGGLAGRNRGTIMSCYSTTIVSGQDRVGGLVGCSSGTITDCYTTGSVISDRWGGGLVGHNDGSLTNCHSTGNVVGNEYIGGLVGDNSGTITSCRSAGQITGKDNTGGLAGSSTGTIGNCYSSSNVSGQDRVGGLVGCSVIAVARGGPGGIGTIIGCYSTGSVTGQDQVGGLAGCSFGTITNCYATGSVIGDARVGGLVGDDGGTTTNCYSAGSVAGNEYVGGLVGDGSRVFESFWDTETSGQQDSAGGEGKSTAEMQMASTFFSWASCGNEALWTIDEGNDYPRLSWENRPGEPVMAMPLSDFLAGSGTESDPYLIYTAEELNLIGLGVCDWDKHFKLMADIDLGQYTADQFNIIGIYWQSPFKGVFDGNGHTITNFSYICTNADYCGLFGYVDDPEAEIKNLTLIQTSIDAGLGYYVGPLVGHLGSGMITNCCVEAGVVSGFMGVGGLVGYKDGGTIANSCATGTVDGYSYSGGLVGRNFDGTIVNCYSTGVAAGEKKIGGLVGDNCGIVINCYSSTTVIGSEDAGGLVGSGWANNVVGSFWDIETSGQLASVGGTDKTTAQMQTAATFFSWGACGNEGIWTIDEGNDYPRLWWEDRPDQVMATIQLADLLGGTGTQDTPFLVQTAGELNLIGLYPCEWDGHFKLMADIDLAQYTADQFSMIGLCDMPFTGVFDGNDHTIANFSYICTSAACSGLFGCVDGPNAEIMNLALIDTSIDAGAGHFMGSVVGYLSDATITNCSSTGTVSGNNYVGGLVGYSNAGTVDNCYLDSTVIGNYITGGLVGCSTAGTITNSYSTGTVTGSSETGGLVGQHSDFGTIVNCYSTSAVTGDYDTGGLAGHNYDASVTNCYSTGTVAGKHDTGGLIGFNSGTVTECYSTGNVIGQEDVGGLVGRCDYDPVIASFWDIETSGQTSSDGGTGKTTAEMQMESTFTDAGWDFVGESVNGTEDIWAICEGVDYPKLTWQFVVGDFDSDMETDFADFCIFAERWLGTDGSFWCGTGGADLTNDGFVDVDDLKELADDWLAGR